MSDNQITFGLIGELTEPIAEESIDFATERFDEIGLGLNYEGTFVYQCDKHGPINENFTIHILSDLELERQRFFAKIWNLGFHITIDNIHPFVDLWYDGVDSNHADLTVEKFRKMTGQTEGSDA
jgi:hypothetical protein